MTYTVVRKFIIRQSFDGHITLVSDYDRYGNLAPIEEFRHDFNTEEDAENAILAYSIAHDTELFNIVILKSCNCQDNH